MQPHDKTIGPRPRIGWLRQSAPHRVLGLPVANAWTAWASVVITLIYYIVSWYPDLSVWDSSLIAMAAIQGGLGHPPGYPLHTLIGMLASKLPGIEPLIGVKLVSAVPGALLCLPMLSLAYQMRGDASAGSTVLGTLSAAVFVVLLCIHPVLWDSSTRVEVYALAAFLATWGVARVSAALGSLESMPASVARPRPRGFFIAGLALGASAAANPVVAAVTSTAAIAALFRVLIRVTTGKWAVLHVIAGGLSGLLFYSRIPIIAGQTDRLVWGAPTTIATLWDFLRARDFAANVGPTASSIATHLYEWIGWSVGSGTLLFALFGFVGWFLLGKKSSLGRSGPIALVFAIFAICANIVWVPENPDYLGYLCGPIALCGAGAAALLTQLGGHEKRVSRMAAIGCLLFFLWIAGFADPAVHSRSRHIDRSARLIAQGALEEAAQNSILLIGSDHLLWPALYLQEIERLREDVVIMPIGLAGLSWYWKYTYQRHPQLNKFELYGPGGSVKRIQRFLAANSDRRVGFESVGMARRAGLKIYGVGWMMLDRPVDAGTTASISAKIEAAAALIGQGSYSGTGTLSIVSYLRGEALWRLNRPRAAYRAILAGVPPSLRPDAQPAIDHWENIPRLTEHIQPGVSMMRGLGNPYRNLSLAQYLVESEKTPSELVNTAPSPQ
jgi:hypothetical protein